MRDQTDHILVAVDPVRGSIARSIEKVAAAEHAQMADALDVAGLHPQEYVSGVPEEQQHGECPGRNGRRRHQRPPAVSHDVSPGNLEKEGHVFATVRCSLSAPSRIAKISSAWEINCGSWVAKMNVVCDSA